MVKGLRVEVGKEIMKTVATMVSKHSSKMKTENTMSSSSNKKIK